MSVMITNELYESSGGRRGQGGGPFGGTLPMAPRDRMQPPEDARGGETMVAGGASPHCGESVGVKSLERYLTPSRIKTNLLFILFIVFFI